MKEEVNTVIEHCSKRVESPPAAGEHKCLRKW